MFKNSGKIVDGWDYKGVDNEDIKEFSKSDLIDNFPDSKLGEFKILTKKGLLNKGIDPLDTNNWYKIDITQ